MICGKPALCFDLIPFWNECFSADNLFVGIGLNIVDLVSLIAPYVWAVGTFLVCFSESSR